MDAINATLLVKAFRRRVLRVIVALDEAMAVAATTQQVSGIGATIVPHMSAASLALQLAPSQVVSIVEKLKTVNPHFFRSLLQAENDAV
eukprot:3785398-Amphidinium_carterae.1